MSRVAQPRVEADARRQSLIEAAGRVLAREGAAGVSVRTICAEAGVSPGLLRHYFSGIDALIADAHAQAGLTFATRLAQARAIADSAPRAQIQAYVHAALELPCEDPELLGAWLAFMAFARGGNPLGVVHGQVQRLFCDDLAALLIACGLSPDAARAGAAGVAALVEGLWLQLSLQPDRYARDELLALADCWIAPLLERNSASSAT